ncbi:TPA: hypothetical protein ACOFBO_004158 [Stenotrophomonas maltophilia]
MKREFVTGTVDKLLSQFKANDSGNAPVLLMLGGFKFSLNTASSGRSSNPTSIAGRRRTASARWRPCSTPDRAQPA